MIPGSFPRIIKLDFSADFSCKPGDVLTITVIKRLIGNKWAVGIKGKVIPAFSEMELLPGQKLKAVVIQMGKSILLKLSTPGPNSFSDYLIQQGFPDDALSNVIILSLIRSQLPLIPEIILKIRQIISKYKKKPQFLARLLSILYEKNINLSSQKIESLLDLLQYGEDFSKQDNKNKKKKPYLNSKEIKEILKKIIKKTEEIKHNPLQVFNHLKGKNPSWIVIPFNVSSEKKMAGTIRILYDSYTQNVEKMTILIYGQDNMHIFFHIIQKKTHKLLMIFCNNETMRRKLKKEIKKLSINLQNTDVKIDDIIYREENFDGFTPLEDLQQYRKINIVLP